MSGERRKEIVRHLSEDDLDRLLAESTDEKLTERLIFIKRIYKGATLEDAADDVGRSSGTGTRWARRWNKGGLGLLMPNFGGGKPPKLGEDQRQRLLDLLRDGQPWKKQEIQHLINEEFDVEFHPVYLSTFLENLSLSYAIPRTKRPSRPENAEEILDERVGDAFDDEPDDIPHNKCEGDDEEGWVVDEEIRTDGGTVLGFLDTSHPQPWDNSQRLYTVDDPHITRPLVKLDEPAVGFYALSGESVVQFPANQEKERICECLEGIREQNPGQRILLVPDNFSSHVCEYTRRRAHQLGIDLVFLPVGSPDLNPIEQVWKSLKWEASPLIVESAAEYRALLTQLFEQLTTQLSFAASWIEEYLGGHLQKLR
ncbi:transposase [Haloarcula marismortui ATCC 43049]|uniref:Transposase n=1 Tax=Haloarcula marismortui (strain ATCC 43049 / DSM 3752 / JCM 8966 / VKM B-1809) TaxID=272569 RepID=Q5V1Y7_HALMA|nr:IS630-like element ISHma2 family transposase [Haloarcula marismortui]AAV46465.1 transposase [Haloarcula marismortui ATCC 43049]QCP91190.1 IS630-like element ISHma2 family transposase [Haloarcula marismortui ATCC 43049]